MLKTQFVKLPPCRISYRKYSKFNADIFTDELSRDITNIYEYDNFEKVFTAVLDKHAPLKTKYVRANNKRYVSKELRKAIMRRSRLKNIANATGSSEDLRAYKRQRNLVVNQNRKDKKSYFLKLEKERMNKDFWNTVKPLFSKKAENNVKQKILLLEDNDICNEDSKIADIFNNYFNRITDNLNIPCIPSIVTLQSDPVHAAIERYASHPSIITIKSRTPLIQKFELSTVSEKEMLKEILTLDESKKVSGSIPIKILKVAARECAPILTKCFNNSVIHDSKFPNKLTLADIIPSHKSGNTMEKSNYRPISLLPTVSKVFERIISKQIIPFSQFIPFKIFVWFS